MSMFEGAIGIVVDPVVDIMVMLISGPKLHVTKDRFHPQSPCTDYHLCGDSASVLWGN